MIDVASCGTPCEYANNVSPDSPQGDIVNLMLGINEHIDQQYWSLRKGFWHGTEAEWDAWIDHLETHLTYVALLIAF